jgi:hypothetical protein
MVKAGERRAGMILAKPLRDLAGRTLLKEGAELTEGYVERIRRWGFEDVAVEGGADEPVELPPVVGYQVAGRPWEEVQAEVEKRFSRSAGDTVLAGLKRAVLARVRKVWDSHAGN